MLISAIKGKGSSGSQSPGRGGNKRSVAKVFIPRNPVVGVVNLVGGGGGRNKELVEPPNSSDERFVSCEFSN